jgi:GxxExxY protein
MDENEVSKLVIGAAIEVHRELGPGLLESTYEDCLAYELDLRDISYERQKKVPVVYKGKTVADGLKVDLLVCGLVIVELKSVEKLTDVHDAQTLTYLKFTGCKLGLLLNFNVRYLRQGIRRLVLNL